VLYRSLTDLDYTQQDVHGTLLSNLPLNINASLSAFHTAALAHFADISTTQRNVITNDDVNGYIDFPVLVDWRAIVGGNGALSRNSNDTFKTQDFNTGEINGGIRYQPSTGNHVDLLYRSVKGTYINGSPAAFVGPEYRDHAVDLSADWTFSGASHLHGRAGYVKRTDDDYVFQNLTSTGTPEFAPGGAPILVDVNRNFAGPAFDLTYLWQLSPFTNLRFYALRETGAAGDNSFQAAVSHVYRVTPTYKPTVKTEFDAYVEYSQRDYFTNIPVPTGLQTGLPLGAQRLDHGHSMGLTAIWTPRQWLKATIDLHQDVRDSNNGFFAYDDTVFSAQFQGSF
jgi:hypothetical protein